MLKRSRVPVQQRPFYNATHAEKNIYIHSHKTMVAPYFFNRGCGTVIKCLPRMGKVVGSNPAGSNQRLKMIVSALSLDAQHNGSIATTGRSGVSICDRMEHQVGCPGLDI